MTSLVPSPVRIIGTGLIGGYAAYVDGRVYDFSYAAQLQTMKQKLS